MKVLIFAVMLAGQFEVASVKPVQERTGPGGFSVRGDLATVRYTTLNSVMVRAFDLKFVGQIDGPSWIRTERYDISAKCPEACGDVGPLLRELLVERFKLVFHHERKEFATYALTVGKGSLKLKADEGKPWETWAMEKSRAAKSMSMKTLAQYLGMTVQAPVADETGLTGHYDFPFEQSVEEMGAKNGDRPSIFTIVEDLGLRLRARKEMFDVVVVDGGSRVPGEN